MISGIRSITLGQIWFWYEEFPTWKGQDKNTIEEIRPGLIGVCAIFARIKPGQIFGLFSDH